MQQLLLALNPFAGLASRGGRPGTSLLRRVGWGAAALILVAGLAIGAGPARAQTGLAAAAGAEALTPEQARNALSILGDDTRRQQVLDALRAIAGVEPGHVAAPAPAVGTAAQGTPAATAAAPAAPPSDKVSLTSDSLLAEIIAALSHWLSALSGHLAAVGATVSSLPLAWMWLVRTATNPFAQSALLDVAWRLAAVVALAWGARWVLRRALRRPLAALERRAVDKAVARRTVASTNDAPRVASLAELRLMQRLPLALVRLVLELIPIGVFALVGNLLLATPLGDGGVTALIIIAAVNAFVIQHVIMATGCAVVSPRSRFLRLFRMSDETAAYAEVWLGRVTGIAIYGMAALEIARILGLYPAAYDSAAKLVVLLNHVLLIVVVLQCRRGVAAMIDAPAGATGGLALARRWLARVWHIVAVFLLLALWFVWALRIENGYGLLLRYVGATAAVLVVARLVAVTVLGLMDRAFRIKAETAQRLPLLEGRANRYVPLLRRGISVAIGAVTVLALLQVWGLDVMESFRDGGLGQRVVTSALILLVAGVLAVMIWEGVNAWIDRNIAEMAQRGDRARSARLRTLLPLLHTTLLVLIVAIVGFTALSQLGVNIAPLLAGAGILGVAVGFGSQKLVQDVITGIFLLLENTMQVGDWVTVSGLSGSVENLSIRTIRLRAGDGSVHVIPFSSVSTVTNTNRGKGNAAVSVTVAFSEDPDRVGRVLKEIGAGLRTDPAFKDGILDDFALWGVDKVDGATFTVLGQMACTDTGRWGVQREFNRRIKQRFEELGIAIAVPAQSVILSRFARTPAEAEGIGGPERRPEPVGADAGAKTQSPPPTALGNTQ
ncbi:mechanosensitive ion channel domain-containing protein [Pararoseomonas indoligenes]|uniref:Mechanosensitive ion channel n=1 Tax=Roseomonas indoligenes TaxID=2820811 RepID=A0A940MX74_9PROT|nr:mechanosensitive ion channel domain-containing protein [Pararoseomonas indoligenes]MBP0493343.1 mechanosensitive ion channel [Pararoseomonas indoligenes]